MNKEQQKNLKIHCNKKHNIINDNYQLDISINLYKQFNKTELLNEFNKYKKVDKKIKKTYICNKCNKIIKSYNNYKHHVKNNVCNKKKLNCDKCMKIFKNNRNLSYHIDNNVCCKNNLEKINNNCSNNVILFNNDIKKINNINGHVYLLEMKDAHNNILYKIGQTTRLDPFKRMQEYGPSKKIIFLKEVKDAKETEIKFKEIIKKDANIKKHEYGIEYFVCDDKNYMIKLLLNID